jgi:uncharacterized membrane protein YccC
LTRFLPTITLVFREKENKQMNEANNNKTKDQLKLAALKQRIGEITSGYEDTIASLRADFTQQFDALQDVLREQDETIEKLQEQLRVANGVVQENTGSDDTVTD